MKQITFEQLIFAELLGSHLPRAVNSEVITLMASNAKTIADEYEKVRPKTVIENASREKASA